MDESEIFKVGEKSYVNPQKGVDETNAFVENLRNTANTETQNIENQTHAMGSDLPSWKGGLSGSGDVWTAQYQTPVLNTITEGLKATAQSEALNAAMSNYQAYLQDQYNQAYRSYTARERAKAAASSGSGSGSGTNTSVETTGGSNKESTGGGEYLVPANTDEATNQYKSDKTESEQSENSYYQQKTYDDLYKDPFSGEYLW